MVKHLLKRGSPAPIHWPAEKMDRVSLHTHQVIMISHIKIYKMTIEKFGKPLVIIALLLLASHVDCIGQKKLDVTAGAGMMTQYNLGARYQVNQTQFGFSVGTHFDQDPAYKTTVLAGSLTQHLFGTARLSETKPWFLKLGVAYQKDKSDSQIVDSGLVDLLGGYEFNFSKKTGLSLAAGVKGRFYKNFRQPTQSTDQNYFPGGAEINFFYHIFSK
jgi:hypothetical protein